MDKMPNVDLTNPDQNAFVQDYLSAFNRQYNEATITTDGVTRIVPWEDYNAVNNVIEQIQEIYSGRVSHE